MHNVLHAANTNTRSDEAIEILRDQFGFRASTDDAPWHALLDKALREARNTRGLNAWDIASMFLADACRLAMQDEQYRHDALHAAPFIAGMHSRLMGNFTGHAMRWFAVADSAKTKAAQQAPPKEASPKAPYPLGNLKGGIASNSELREKLPAKRLPPLKAPDHPPISASDILIPAEEVAARLRTSRKTIQRLCRAGQIRFVPGRPVRLVAADVDRYIERLSKLHDTTPPPTEAPAQPKRRGRRPKVKPWRT